MRIFASSTAGTVRAKIFIYSTAHGDKRALTNRIQSKQIGIAIFAKLVDSRESFNCKIEAIIIVIQQGYWKNTK